jgi:hypothetical protein
MKIVHTADLHLGYRQYGFAQREDDFVEAFKRVVDRAIALKADVLVIAGDLFDMTKPLATTVWQAYTHVWRARNAGVMVVGIDGNHDACSSDWLNVCGIFPLNTTDDKGMYSADGVTIRGINACRPAVFHQTVDELVESGRPTDVLVIHQALGEFADFEAQEITALDLAPKLSAAGIRVVCMGDLHEYKETVVGGVRFIYSGSTEVNAVDENRDKCFSIIDIAPEEVSTSYEPIATRQIVEYHLTNEAELDKIISNAMQDDIEGANPLTFIWYDPAVRDLAKRAEVALRDRHAMYRSAPLSTDGDTSLRQKLIRQGFERKGAMEQLKNAVSAFFDEDTDEYQLVFQLLDNPDSVTPTVEQYLKSKGVMVQ